MRALVGARHVVPKTEPIAVSVWRPSSRTVSHCASGWYFFPSIEMHIISHYACGAYFLRGEESRQRSLAEINSPLKSSTRLPVLRGTALELGYRAINARKSRPPRTAEFRQPHQKNLRPMQTRTNSTQRECRSHADQTSTFAVILVQWPPASPADRAMAGSNTSHSYCTNITNAALRCRHLFLVTSFGAKRSNWALAHTTLSRCFQIAFFCFPFQEIESCRTTRAGVTFFSKKVNKEGVEFSRRRKNIKGEAFV